VGEAEAPVLILARASFRRAMRSLAGAARPLADGRIRPRAGVFLRLHADTIEERRVEFHDPSL
jgi:hypothetical protein